MSLSPLSRRILIVSAITVLAVSGAFAIELLLTERPERPFGHSESGHLTGWLGLAVIGLVFVYSYKKRKRRKPGWPRGWFWVHILAGIAGPLIILVHSGAHFHALVPVLAMLAMGFVVLSGVTGQASHYLAVRRLNDTRRDMQQQGLSAEDIDTHLHLMAAREEAFRAWQYIHAPLTVAFLALALMHIAGALYFGGP